MQVWQFSLCVFISTSSNVSWGRKPNPVKRVCLLFTKQNREKDLNSSFVRQLNQNATNWSNQTTIIVFCKLTENGTSIKCKAAFETCTVTRKKNTWHLLNIWKIFIAEIILLLTCMRAGTEIKEMATIYVRIIWQVCLRNVHFQWKSIINRI